METIYVLTYVLRIFSISIINLSQKLSKMKKTITLSVASIIALGLMSFGVFTSNDHGTCSGVHNQKSANGSQIAWTNSPPDGAGTCSSGGGCHGGGSATPVISFTSSPAFGAGNTYVPGTVYTISFKVTGYPYYGYDIEMLNGNTTSATAAGTFAALTNSQIHPAGTYPINITQATSGKIAATIAATFKWTAPASGTVYVYGDGNGVNGDGGTNGDNAVLFTKVLTRASGVGISENVIANINLSVFPNPVSESAHVSYELSENSTVSASLINMTGQTVATFFNKEDQSIGIQNKTLTLDPSIAKGIYFVAINVNGKNSYKKIVVQ